MVFNEIDLYFEIEKLFGTAQKNFVLNSVVKERSSGMS